MVVGQFDFMLQRVSGAEALRCPRRRGIWGVEDSAPGTQFQIDPLPWILANPATATKRALSVNAMLSEIPDDEFAAALDACAAEVLWEAGVTEPPVDALAVADGLGLVVARDFAMPYRGRFVRLAENEGGGGGQGTIVVGEADRPEREQW